MTCDQCDSTVTQTTNLVDGQSTVDFDLIARLVKIQSSQDRADLVEARAEGGYPPAQ